MIQFTAYTDGAYSSTRQLGAWAFLIKEEDDQNFDVYYSQAELIEAEKVTSQVAELTAVQKLFNEVITNIAATEGDAKDIHLTVYSDSTYCVNGVNDWMHKWRHKNWKGASRKPVLNVELWIDIMRMYNLIGKIEMIWVKGHSGVLGNEIVDELCSSLTQS